MISPINAPLAPLSLNPAENCRKFQTFTEESDVRRAIAVTQVVVHKSDPTLAADVWGFSRYSLSTALVTYIGVTGIYALICPLTDRLRYVGSSRDIAARYPKRKTTRRRDSQREVGSEFHEWFSEIFEAKAQVKIRVLESFSESADIFKREQMWINWFKGYGLADLNKINTPNVHKR